MKFTAHQINEKAHLVKVLNSTEDTCLSCCLYIKWDDIFSDTLRVDFGLRQGAVLSP